MLGWQQGDGTSNCGTANVALGPQQVVVWLTAAQAFRCEKLRECLWPGEKLSVDEISRRLLLEHLLWAESERGMVESVRTNLQGVE